MANALGSRNGEGRMLKNVQNSDVVQRRVPSLFIPSGCFAKKNHRKNNASRNNDSTNEDLQYILGPFPGLCLSNVQITVTFDPELDHDVFQGIIMPIPSYKASILPQYYISESFPRIGWAIVELDCCFTISKRMGHDGPWFSLSSNFEAQSFRSTSLHWWYFSSSHQPLLQGFVSPILT